MRTDVFMEQNDKAWIKFGDLDVGDYFVSAGLVYVKIDTMYIQDNGQQYPVNALRANGCTNPTEFDDEHSVKFVTRVKFNFWLGDKYEKEDKEANR